MRFLKSFCFILALGFPAVAGDQGMASSGDIMVHEGWARASLGKAPNSAAYMMLMNHGDAADKLTGATTPMAEKAELHHHIMEGDIAKMRQIDEILVQPGDAVTLEPGGLHVMLMGLKGELDEGSTLPITLIFENAGEITLDVPVHGLTKGKKGDGDHRHDG